METPAPRILPLDSEAQAAMSRRKFVEGTLAAAAAAPSLGALSAFAAEAAAPKANPPAITRKIKIGLIGYGGRGSWITSFFQKHGGFQFHAVAEYFPEIADQAGNALGIDKTRRFSGLSGYKRLIDSGVEAVVIEDIPCFYPEQAKAAVEAGCHVYIAKPVAIDVPGCLTIQSAAQLATQKRRCFLVDYQLPTQPPNIEVANRIREGGLGRLAHILSYGLDSGGTPPPKGPTLESRFRGQTWTGDIALGGDVLLFFDIHIIDGVTWVTGKRPVAACGRSRICRPNPNGDRIDLSSVVYEYDDGVVWNHVTNSLPNNCDFTQLTASFFGMQATAHIQYWSGKVYVRGGSKHYVGEIGSVFDDGVARNVAEFYRNVTEGHFDNPTAKRAVDGTLAAILGREAAARRCYLTMEEVIRENKKLEVDLKGLKG